MRSKKSGETSPGDPRKHEIVFDALFKPSKEELNAMARKAADLLESASEKDLSSFSED